MGHQQFTVVCVAQSSMQIGSPEDTYVAYVLVYSRCVRSIADTHTTIARIAGTQIETYQTHIQYTAGVLGVQRTHIQQYTTGVLGVHRTHIQQYRQQYKLDTYIAYLVDTHIVAYNVRYKSTIRADEANDALFDSNCTFVPFCTSNASTLSLYQ